MRIRGMILCEGYSDQILLGQFISKVNDVEYIKQLDNNPFPKESVNWYIDCDLSVIGVWCVNGNDFCDSLGKIFEREKREHIIESIVVVTDFDDLIAKTTRPESICNLICDTLDISNDTKLCSEVINCWQDIEFEGSFSQMATIKYCYLLVPSNSVGALETFMLDALAKEDESNYKAIEQVKEFVKNFVSDKYLKKRGEKVKGELSITISVFNPKRMFDTMSELINSIDWSYFDQTEQQFRLLRDI